MNAARIQLKLLWQIITLSRRLLLHEYAKKQLGKDASPADRVDDVVGCAESVTEILKALGLIDHIITGTWTLDQHFSRSFDWERVPVPLPGDIVISPTGTGNGSIRGHVGIVGENGTIMSSDSATGKWMSNFTIDQWFSRYWKRGGIPTKFYRLTTTYKI